MTAGVGAGDTSHLPSKENLDRFNVFVKIERKKTVQASNNNIKKKIIELQLLSRYFPFFCKENIIPKMDLSNLYFFKKGFLAPRNTFYIEISL